MTFSIIKNLNTNKAHGWGDISTWMIQSWETSVVLVAFKTILEEGTFPED